MKIKTLVCTLIVGIIVVPLPLLTMRSAKLQGQEVVMKNLANRKTKLEDQLRVLEDNLALMGKNHPHLEATRKKIKETREELVALGGPDALPEVEEVIENPDVILEQMSDVELRQAVLQLFVKVSKLENRIKELEGGGLNILPAPR